MNQCIINIVDQSVFVAFNQIIGKGKIEVWKFNNNISPVLSKEIAHTNFENLSLEKGKYRVEIEIDGQKIIKNININ